MEKIERRVLLELLENHPTLSAWGMGPQSLYESRGVDLEGSRKQLRDGFEEFELCCLWLSACKTTPKASLSSPSSFELKGKIEMSFRKNVSNGAFIAAALHLGVPLCFSRQSPTVHVGVSRLCHPEAGGNLS